MSSVYASSGDANTSSDSNPTGLCNHCHVLPFDRAALDRAVQLLQAVEGRDEPFHCLQAAMSDERSLEGVVEKARVVCYLQSRFGMPPFAAEWLWDNYVYAWKLMYYESKIGCEREGVESESECE